jgi:hypothetical protein
MKTLAWVLVPLLAAGVLAGPLLSPAAAQPAAGWEYLHLLIPLERRLERYRRDDPVILEPLRRAGEEGWELVSAYEPSHGMLVEGRASVEFWLKRPRTR